MDKVERRMGKMEKSVTTLIGNVTGLMADREALTDRVSGLEQAG